MNNPLVPAPVALVDETLPLATSSTPEGEPPVAHRRRPTAGRVLAWCVMGLIIMVTLFPFYWILRTALSTNPSLIAEPTRFTPPESTLDGFRRVLGPVHRFQAARRPHRDERPTQQVLRDHRQVASPPRPRGHSG